MGQGYRPTVGTGQNTTKGPLGSFENPYSGIATEYPTYDPYTGLPINQPGMKHGGHIHHYDKGGNVAAPALPAPVEGTNQAVLEAMNRQYAAMAAAPPPPPVDPSANNAFLSSLAAKPYNPNWTGPTPPPADTSPAAAPPAATTTPTGPKNYSNISDLLNSVRGISGMGMGTPSYTYDPVTGQYTSKGGLDLLHGGIHMAQGGLADFAPTYAAGGQLLKGDGDGMSDSIPAVIGGHKPQRAALADGEFVVPADVVSHLGNGSTSAGAKKLYSMMNKIRLARTGNPKQGKQINPDKFLPV
jgi:hypothetical protein